MVVVAEHVAVGFEVFGLLAERSAEDREEYLATLGLPVDVEPACGGGGGAVAEYLPQGGVVAGDIAMWLGTMSTTSPRPWSLAMRARARRPGSPPSSSRTRVGSVTS
ncbi:hypothetical protein SHKM778_29520 [Streptomyces sp. KM77-8]|uniref:Uncharacterized protein n=1 Tax=Streptomyces haneummycinicus TaxID=3074435 RepID=A0AAT9HGF8_9ACTN